MKRFVFFVFVLLVSCSNTEPAIANINGVWEGTTTVENVSVPIRFEISVPEAYRYGNLDGGDWEYSNKFSAARSGDTVTFSSTEDDVTLIYQGKLVGTNLSGNVLSTSSSGNTKGNFSIERVSAKSPSAPRNYTGLFKGYMTFDSLNERSADLSFNITKSANAYAFVLKNEETGEQIFTGDCAPGGGTEFLCFYTSSTGVWSFEGRHTGSNYSGVWDVISVSVNDKGTFNFSK